MASKEDEITFCKDENGDDIFLGEGSFCVVMKGKKGRMDVALKRMQKCPGLEKVIERETRIFESIELCRRENIVGYYRRYLEPKKRLQYLVMELCDATLKDMIENTPHWQRVCLDRDIQEDHINRHELLRQCLNGIYGLHKERIAHRDVKPSNILLKIERVKVNKTKQIVAKVADFGLSHEADRETDYTHSTVMPYAATKGWMSPELDKQQKEEVNERGDIFSMGLLIFYTLNYNDAGLEFLFGDTKEEAQSNIRNADESYRNDQLEALDVIERHLLKRMTRQDPATRPCVMECKMHPLFMNATQKIKMIKDFANATEAKNTDVQTRTVREDFAIEISVCDNENWNWKDEMGQQMKLDKHVKKMNSQNYIEVVRVLRHKHTHKRDADITDLLIKELWDVDPTDPTAEYDPAKYLYYFTRRFPAMVTDVWDVMTTHHEHLLKQHCEMKESIHHKTCPIYYCSLNKQ